MNSRYDWTLAPPDARFAVTNAGGGVEWWAAKPWNPEGSALWADTGHYGKCEGLVAGGGMARPSGHPPLDAADWRNSLEARPA